MVEYTTLDTIFRSLADPTRRDLLHRLRVSDYSVSELAEHYDLTFAAISKHLQVLERANLIQKRRNGREQRIELVPESLAHADDFLQDYRNLWEKKLDKLGTFIKNNP
jgi:DNA-binding transcriptional ArsR family regulator